MKCASAAWERAMRVQDVLLRAMSGEVHWFQAAEILQMAPQSAAMAGAVRAVDCNGLVDKRRCPSTHRVPMAELKRVLRLYRERYQRLNGRHFHEIVRGMG